MDIFQYFLEVLLPSVFGISLTSGSSEAAQKGPNYSPLIGIQNYSQEHIASLLKIVNGLRSKVEPPAEKMNYLEWDEELAQQALSLASSSNPGNYDYTDAVLVSHSEFNDNFLDDEIAETWLSINYDVSADLCLSTLTMCNDYKLLTREDSSKIGCSTYGRKLESDDGYIYWTACKFDKLLTSGVPYRSSKTPCVGCLAYQKCFDNLCRNVSQINKFTKNILTTETTTTPIDKDITSKPISTDEKPHSGNASGATDSTEAWQWQSVQKRGVSWVAFIILCVILAITFVLAMWALVLAYRLKSKITVDNKNF